MYERRTKIVATIGPASEGEEILERLIKAGLDVARLNFSHGSYDDHEEIYKRIRKISKKLGKAVTIMQDMQGPKIRTGEIEGKSITLKPDQRFTLTTKKIKGTNEIVSVDLPQLIQSVKPGGRILLDDGKLELVVTGIYDDRVETRVVLGGVLKEHKGVNLPGARLDIPGFTSKDEEDLEFGLKLGVDAVAVSFVRSARDVQLVRQAITRREPKQGFVPIIAKMERPEAMQNLDEIVEVADGVMVARGDLGVEMLPESVPIAQKRIIACANKHAKVVITATQMLDSMINNPRPTRAEATDVANAIFDGTDAVMLSGETAVGKYPIQSIEMMNAIACQAESSMREYGHWSGAFEPESGQDDTYFMTQAARELAHDRNVEAIAVFTKSGRTALLMSKTRPDVPILAFTPEAEAYNRMGLYWGVYPYHVPQRKNIEDMLESVEKEMVASSTITPGQQVVLICGFPVHAVRPTNLALLYTVGEDL